MLSEHLCPPQRDFRTLLLNAKINGSDSLYFYEDDQAANVNCNVAQEQDEGTRRSAFDRENPWGGSGVCKQA
ncbi:MAG: hypothetical protein RIS36_1222 [Pseudomonadota bacterium]